MLGLIGINVVMYGNIFLFQDSFDFHKCYSEKNSLLLLEPQFFNNSNNNSS